MRWGCVPEGAAAAGAPRWPGVLLLIVLAGIVSVALRAVQLEQPLSVRIGLLALVAGAGALLAAAPLMLLAAWLARRWRPVLRASLAALWMLAAFVPGTLFAFAIENRLIEGRIEADSVADLGARELFWTLFGGMGLFTPTGLAYLLPWPILVVALAAFLCFYRWPQAARSPA
jgi:hypothetical protein